ncbi:MULTISPECIES: DNA-directed RNA polymerase [Bacillus subtilis group]|uniref:DNA-directed RNA polymerase n=1 Tax=Bacillus subtilis group TaxID=653685 RepID=UPI00207B3EA7|nr:MULTISPECIES: DNA-directed RNA polymerase [Bacillus subtilis group]MCY7767706.1 DNA-directed RNA polymerase [Bacillus inaquosorum]
MEQDNTLVEKLKLLDEGLRKELNQYKDMKEIIEGNDYVQILTEITPIVKFAKGVYDFSQEIKFSWFLKGFREEKKPLESQIQKLRKYISNRHRAEFIANTINGVLAANSSEACLIIGTILNSTLKQDKEISHEKLVCINALTSLFNNDINNLEKISDYVFKSRGADAKSIIHEDVWSCCENDEAGASSLYLTLDKCVSFQIVSREYETRTDSSIDIEIESVDVDTALDDYYVITSAGSLLFDYIKRIKSYYL